MMHIPDEQLLLAAEGELPELQQHLDKCPVCRKRLGEMNRAFAAYAAEYRTLPPPSAGVSLQRAVYTTVAALLIAIGGGALFSGLLPRESGTVPNSVVTPGATRPVSVESLCGSGAEGERQPQVPTATAQRVFARYGILNPRPRSYEVDYVIPPSLGGADDERNLWPQPYSQGTWTARVKDALEERLWTMVCRGDLDLATAQRDLASNWIGAYKKYFGTDRPYVQHVAFVKDRPWE